MLWIVAGDNLCLPANSYVTSHTPPLETVTTETRLSAFEFDHCRLGPKSGVMFVYMLEYVYSSYDLHMTACFNPCYLKQ